jgi:hypothetical protein
VCYVYYFFVQTDRQTDADVLRKTVRETDKKGPSLKLLKRQLPVAHFATALFLLGATYEQFMSYNRAAEEEQGDVRRGWSKSRKEALNLKGI